MSLNTPPPPITEPRIPSNYMENGREYHGFHKGKYLLPCDETEMDRMDIYHKFYSVARREHLHSAPFTPNYDGPRILDLGTGTGIWAIDMADKYPSSEVQGVDITMMQPQQIPPNLTFLQRDIEGPWHGMGLDSWDLIHMRMLSGCVENWADVYAKVFRHLKPEFGWLEQVEIDMVPRCDDGTLPPNSQLVNWTRQVLEATATTYRPLAYNTDTRFILERQGFVDIQEEIIKVPMNPWETDPHLKNIGRWYNLGLTQGLDALSIAPLMRIKGWKKPEVDRIVQDVKREVCSKRIHAYCNMHIWIARRPA
ncbi:Secondary metabolism regulator [Lachnellula suecica]|uniref:Secondary metabolism regulator n=1 Tax=Lachnellula suecica TaxID=602035 RepID=A0A8T9BYB5_9HELO|nr:Secondary metabolism regulator [Lachnellula suecica]